MSNILTSERLNALKLFAKREGRYWKEALRLCWQNGNYEGHNDISAELQQVRNIHGPSWLVRFRLPK